jgi:Tfp pilus assembly protein PilF
VSADPVDIQPLIELAQIKAALGQLGQARNELTKATSVQPSNPQAWLWLAGFDQAHGRPADALRELHRAWLLEPYSGLSAYTLTQYR